MATHRTPFTPCFIGSFAPPPPRNDPGYATGLKIKSWYVDDVSNCRYPCHQPHDYIIVYNRTVYTCLCYLIAEPSLVISILQPLCLFCPSLLFLPITITLGQRSIIWDFPFFNFVITSFNIEQSLGLFSANLCRKKS